MKACDDPKWDDASREILFDDGVELTTAEAEAEGIPATHCANCGHVEDEPEPPEEVEDRCLMCGEEGYISTGYLIRRRGVDYFLGRA